MMKLTSMACILLLAGTACSQSVGSNAVPAAPAAREVSSGRDATAYKVIFTFSGDDGSMPEAPLVAVKGKLYGTAWDGGKSECGVVFSLATTGKDQKVVHDFASDGCNPLGLTYAKKSLYGITYGGGTGSRGSVFRMKTDGDDDWSYDFYENPSGGENPDGGVILYKGNAYGTTSAGGNVCGGDGCGTVFKATKKGQVTILYNFEGEEHGKYDGEWPYGGLVQVKGVLYGTTAYGGDHDGGTVFSVTTSGKEQVLWSFFGTSSDADRPAASLIAVDGILYGTSLYGGKYGDGTVFSVTTGGEEAVVHSFGSGNDGKFPQARLVDVNGTLYGTTSAGGSSSNCADGCGTVFEVSPSGGETVLHSFQGGKDGATPLAGLLSLKGKLYGTTSQGGGSENHGTVFTLTP